MDIEYIGKDLLPTRPAEATIGFFDGVHRGHQYLLRQLCADARRRGLCSLVVTFDRHPRQVLQPDWHPQLLTTFDERLALLEQTGIDRCAVLPFSPALAALSARDFMRQVLRDQLGVCRLSIGYDHHFGHRQPSISPTTGGEGFEQYVGYGRELGIEVVQNTAFSPAGEHLSSSVVRRLLQVGDVSKAARFLGRCHTLSGIVVSGEHVGRTLGFPTANVQPDSADKIVPAAGAYAVNVLTDDAATPLPAMMNIGTRPTYGGHAQTLEVHILDYQGDLYGQRLRIRFVERLRDEQAFADGESLRQQLLADAERARQCLQEQKTMNDEL